MSGPLERLLNLLYPEKCTCCGVLTGGGVLCASCAKTLERLTARRRTPRHSGDTDAICAVFAYSGAGAALIQAFKFRGKTRCYGALRAEFEEGVKQFYAGEIVDLIVPVPMYRAAKRERGFNQAEHIAQGLARAMGIPCDVSALSKHKANRVQHRLPAGERAENVKNVYTAHGNLQGKAVLLVDDIVTTGATLSACARALRAAGAARVLCAAVLAAP